jgi:hypothetical protein
VKNLKVSSKKRRLTDIENIKNFLVKLGFVCISFPSSQNLIYTKNKEIIIIKNRREEIKK